MESTKDVENNVEVSRYQKALNRLKNCKLFQGNYVILDFGELFEKEIETIQELVEKEKHKVPLKIKDMKCPYCEKSFLNYEGMVDPYLLGEYCQFCGEPLGDIEND